jgi:hypothetical protein
VGGAGSVRGDDNVEDDAGDWVNSSFGGGANERIGDGDLFWSEKGEDKGCDV